MKPCMNYAQLFMTIMKCRGSEIGLDVTPKKMLHLAWSFLFGLVA